MEERAADRWRPVGCGRGPAHGAARVGGIEWETGGAAELLAELKQQPENDTIVMRLAWIAALSGNREEALRRAVEAARLRPESVDAWFSAHLRPRLAVVHAWNGDKDRAIADYARLLRVPNRRLNIHEIKRSPVYAPLRGDPRWEALLNEPKNNAPLF